VIDRELIDKYIEPNPGRPGVANARLATYAVPVWALVGYFEAVHGDVDRVAHDYGLPHEAVEAALAYYRQHKGLIDGRLAANAS
jgi:uncharacterized protein (DUF433 family)